MTAAEFLSLLKQARKSGPSAWMASCPAHHDPKASLSVKQTGGRLLIFCHAGCEAGAVVEAVGLGMHDLFVNENGSSGAGPAAKRTAPPLRLAEFASAKRLPVELLLAHGVEEVQGGGLLFKYKDRDGQPTPRGHLRPSLVAPEWKWLGRTGDPIVAYGLDWRGGPFDARDWALVVEGESDVLTAHLHDVPAIGIPAASMSKVLRSEDLEGIARLYIVREPDKGGETFVAGLQRRLAGLGWAGEAFVVTLREKDLSALHLSAGEAFDAQLKAAMAAAKPLPLTGSAPDSTLRPLAEVIHETIGELRKGPPRAISTPFPTMNHLLGGGFLPGELVYAGGLPGSGKTAIALEMVLWAASHGDPVAIFSAEMTRTAIGRRVLAQQCRVPAIAFRSGKLEPYWPVIDQAEDELGSRPVWVDDETSDVDVVVEKVKAHDPRPRLVVCDYLQLLGAAKRFASDRERVEYVSQRLLGLAKQGFVVLCLSSLTRPDKRARDRMPSLHDFRGSGSLGHDAHVALLLHRPAKERVQTVCHIEKARDAQVGFVHLAFRPEFLIFEEPGTAEAGDGDEGRL